MKTNPIAVRRMITLLAGVSLCALSFILPGCSDNKQPATASTSAGSGKVIIKGSNTIGEELAPRLIAEYKKEHPDTAFELESKATGYGLAALLAGQCDIAAASRAPIKDEQELAKSRGVELAEHVIGAYGVEVVVHANNPVGKLTLDQVRDIFTGTIQNWKEVGGPDAAIHLYVRDPISGTYLGFRELAMDNKPYTAGIRTFTNYDGIVQAVGQDTSGIGYSGIDGTIKAGVKALSIKDIVPSATAVNEGKYPYARVLRLYTNKAKEAAPARDFLAFVQSTRGQDILKQMGFVPHP